MGSGPYNPETLLQSQKSLYARTRAYARARGVRCADGAATLRPVSRREKNAARRASLLAQVERDRKKQLLHEAASTVADLVPAPRRGIDPAEGIQEILDNLMALYRLASSKVFFLAADDYFKDTIAGPVPNEWIREQERLGMQVVHVAGKAASMGLAERAVRIQEAQAAMFATILEAALKQQGLEIDDRRSIMNKVAEELDAIEARGVELLERVA